MLRQMSTTSKLLLTMLTMGTIITVALIAAEPLGRAVALATWPMLILIGLALILATGVGLVWLALHSYESVADRRTERRLKQAQVKKLEAEADKIRKDSDVYVVKAKLDEQIIIGKLSEDYWRNATLDPRRYANGPGGDREPSHIELGMWSQWHQQHATARRGSSQEPPQIVASTAWPTQVDLLDLLPHGPTLQHVVLGVTVDERGQRQTVAAPLAKLVHIAVGGSSGWGKSVFLRGLAYQIVAAPEAAELALIDLEATTFSPFATSPRLRCEIADTEQMALDILSNLTHELEYRKRLFKKYPTVEKLADYNRRADTPLPVVALLIDEATALLADNHVENQLRTLALRARKYGIYAVLGGQDWKAARMDTAIRNQLSTRVQFKAQDAGQSRILLGRGDAARIEQLGRAYAILPGQPHIELQAPHIALETIIGQLGAGGVQPPPPSMMPQAEEPVPQPTEEELLILKMFDDEASYREITTALWNQHGRFYNDKVEAVLIKHGRI